MLFKQIFRYFICSTFPSPVFNHDLSQSILQSKQMFHKSVGCYLKSCLTFSVEAHLWSDSDITCSLFTPNLWYGPRSQLWALTLRQVSGSPNQALKAAGIMTNRCFSGRQICPCVCERGGAYKCRVWKAASCPSYAQRIKKENTGNPNIIQPYSNPGLGCTLHDRLSGVHQTALDTPWPPVNGNEL